MRQRQSCPAKSRQDLCLGGNDVVTSWWTYLAFKPVLLSVMLRRPINPLRLILSSLRGEQKTNSAQGSALLRRVQVPLTLK